MHKILNVIIDEKFIDGIIECHDLFADKAYNEYVIVGRGISPFLYIKKYPNRVKFISDSFFLTYLEENDFHAVFLHSFACLKPDLILKIPEKIKVFWFSWGYDIYTFPLNPFIKIDLYGEETKKVKDCIQKGNNFFNQLKSFVKKWIGFEYVYKKIKSHIYYKAISRVDYFSGVLDCEYSMMKNVKNFRAKKVSYTYTTLSLLNSLVDDEVCSGNNILVGNSAAYTNNHLDVIKYLKDICLGDSIVYMPLSYSGGKEYVDYVKSVYSKLFGQRFIPLDCFMSGQAYADIISSCSVAIFAHERQQAMGNISLAIRKGCKIYLSETNAVYKSLKELGLTVFSLQKDLSPEQIMTPMTKEQILENKKIIHKYRNRDAYERKMNYILDCIK